MDDGTVVWTDSSRLQGKETMMSLKRYLVSVTFSTKITLNQRLYGFFMILGQNSNGHHWNAIHADYNGANPGFISPS